MDFKNILRLLGIGLLALTIGIALGYHFAPDKIRIQEKIIEKEKIVKEEYTKKTKKYDKDGKVIEEIDEKGSKQTDINTKKTDKTTEKEKTQKHYAIKGGAVLNPRDPNGIIPRVGAEMRLPFFNSWIGAEVDINVNKPLVGGYLRVEF